MADRWPKSPPRGFCDLVMKGGITSGVIYPPAIVALREQYRFKHIGGASAGAIAAAIAAAAEYGTQAPTNGRGGFAELDSLATELAAPDFIERLFQPTEAARPIFEALLSFVTARAPGLGKYAALLGRLLLIRWRVVLAGFAGTVLWLAFAIVTSWALLRGGASGLDVAAVVLLAAVSGAGLFVLWILAALVALWGAFAELNAALVATGFGMCLGTTQPGADSPALADWLDAKLQDAAGLPHSEPLTFAKLAQCEIDLHLITTDLSGGRPVALPLPEDSLLLYDPEELKRFLPGEAMEHLNRVSREMRVDGRRFHYLPGQEMPILLAVRLSLSFPILLSAIRFYTENESVPAGVAEHWFSDGGISSNFPIHFFDSWLPEHPTFGLDLMGYPDARLGQKLNDPDDPTMALVYMPKKPSERPPLRYSRVDGIPGFFKQMFDAARNWRDTMQMELPGFSDRVCHIRLRAEEGGLNLNMDSSIVAGLLERGAEAGKAILQNFDFDEHRFTRYLSVMPLLESDLHTMHDAFGAPRTGGQPPLPGYRDMLGPGVPPTYDFATDHDPGWCRLAVDATDSLLAVAVPWAPRPAFGFEPIAEQAGVMRTVPDV
jgi:hypothetical protein